jgi:hypothetical protein
MKALCLKQPYASWIAEGKKTIETRTWKTNYRGRFLVVASRGLDLLRELELPIDEYPIGVALAIAKILNCRPMKEQDEKAACCEFHDGAYAWELGEIQRIDPFPVKGQLSFFNVPYGPRGKHQTKLRKVA